jgi:electron transfer flavoprotein beta subunit
MVLSEAIRRINRIEEVAVVICGKQTIDGDTAQVGPGIATRLKYTQLTLVDQIQDLDLPGRKVRVRRKLEGRHEIIEADLPALITVVREINEPRYPTVPSRLSSENASVTLWDNKILQLPEDSVGLKGSVTQVSKIFSPERSKGELLGDGINKPEETARLLIDTLLQKDIISI